MKMNNPFKGLSSGPAVSNINRKQKLYKGLILTGNRHKQQVWEEEFFYNVTGNLLLHDWKPTKRYGILGWVKVKRLGPGPVWG